MLCVAGRKDGKRKDPKKEDRAAFLARTQAQRESRQHTRHENNSAAKMQAMVRRAKDLAAARQDILERLNTAMHAELATTWQHTSNLLRLVCLARPGGPTRSELMHAVKTLLTSLTSGSSDDNYACLGLREHASVMQLQLKRICGYVIAEMVRCRWTMQGSERPEEDAALLKALFLLTDSAQWKAVGGIPAAAKVCSEVVGWLVAPPPRGHKTGAAGTNTAASAAAAGESPAAKSSTDLPRTPAKRARGLYESLREVLCPTSEYKGTKGTAQAPLLWTLAIRPLTAGFPPGDPRQVWVAFAFAREILSIPCVLSEMPELLRQATLHQSVWPRVVFSLGTAAQIHPLAPGQSPSSPPPSSTSGDLATGGAAWVPEERVLNVFANVVELTHKAPIPGNRLFFLSFFLLREGVGLDSLCLE